jgi:heme-degrading monooxygenase HmoA
MQIGGLLFVTTVQDSFGRVHMILEIAVLFVRHGDYNDFECAFSEAQVIISSMPGFIFHQLQRCLEMPGKYVMLVHLTSLEDHMIGFRPSIRYREWKRLLHHFFDPFPTVEHFGVVHERGLMP